MDPMNFKNRTLLLILTLSSFIVFGQANSFTTTADNDPEATAILENIKKDFNSYQSLEVDFNLIIKLPEQEEEIQNGFFIQYGNKFVTKMESQEVYCDGVDIWVYMISDEEIQILEYDEEDVSNMMSPQQIIKIYENDEYIYTITGEEKVNGKTLTAIEFKPVNRSSEYAKLKMLAVKSSNALHSMKIYSKDGSQFTLLLKNLIPNKSYSANTFVLDTKLFPDVHIEDLRL